VQNVVRTRTLSLRIPEELSQKIDGVLFDRVFTNRPDFIVTAIRFTNDWILEHYSERIIHVVENQDKVILDESKMNNEKQKTILNLMKDRYNSMQGEMVLILVVYPEGLSEVWPKALKYGVQLSNFQDYVRIAIVFYLTYRKTINNMIFEGEKIKAGCYKDIYYDSYHTANIKAREQFLDFYNRKDRSIEK